jgi:hypothetical protein
MLLPAIQDLVTVDAGQYHFAQLIWFQVAATFGVSEAQRPINQTTNKLQFASYNAPTLEQNFEFRAFLFPSNGLLPRL